jgi:g-D-glutamyl-meso-diaminopimelate peptidase
LKNIKKLLCISGAVIFIFTAACQNSRQNPDPSGTEEPVLIETPITTYTPDITFLPTALPQTPAITPVSTPVSTEKSEGLIIDPYTVYTSETFNMDANKLRDQFPDLVTVESIGKSVKGTDIKLIKFGKGSRKVLITAGIHARENININLIMRCINEYANAYESCENYGNYNVKSILDSTTIYFVPLINPDGLDIVNALADPILTSLAANNYIKVTWKANANGVDLNRNFPYLWDTIISRYPDYDKIKAPYYRSFPGYSAASEPETKAIVDLCAAYPFEFLVSLHTKGQIICWRDLENEVIEGDDKLAAIIENCLGYSRGAQTDNPGGGFDNWFRSAFKKPGIVIEMAVNDSEVPYNILNRSNYTNEPTYDIYSLRVLNWDKSKCLILAMLNNYF